MDTNTPDGTFGLKPYLSKLAVLALSFGYAVGWGAFVMPGTTFLPDAGPLGTLLSFAIGAMAVLAIAWCYHRMTIMGLGPGGAFAFTEKLFRHDHAFVVAWFLCLAYLAILWANATALILLVRYLFGNALQFGFHYNLAGFDIYLGEALLASLTTVAAGALCAWRKKAAACAQIALAVVFVASVATCFTAALLQHKGGIASTGPAFSPLSGKSPFWQTLRIVAMVPWAYAGFEGIVHSATEFNFPVKRTFSIMVWATVLSTLVYLALAFLPVLAIPAGYATWADYIGALPDLEGIDAMPVFAAAKTSMGTAGVAVITFAMVAGQLTGIIASYIAVSRMMYDMSRKALLPKWFGALRRDSGPGNAIMFAAAISFFMPFFGRTTLDWIVDTSSIGTTIAAGYTAAAACKVARANSETATRLISTATIAICILLSALLFIPNVSGASMSAQAYLVMAFWCLAGFICYRELYKRDTHQRFGRNAVVWMMMVVAIVLSALMWGRQKTCDLIQHTISISSGQTCPICGLDTMSHDLNASVLRTSLVEAGMFIAALAILLNLFSILRKREEKLIAEKTRAEETNKAKSLFFSTVSHDIRTPLNAIIGFSQMLKTGFESKEDETRALDAILMSGETLLSLVNDVLDLSKLEAGKMQIEPVSVDVKALADSVVSTFKTSGKNPDVAIRTQIGEMPYLMLDPRRIRQIIFNLAGNALKFTKKGYVEIRASFESAPGSGFGSFTIAVEDTGCGIGEEDLKIIASEYVQLASSRDTHAIGTGLGLAICRQLANAMGGSLEIASTLGRGSTFSIVLPYVETTLLEPVNNGAISHGQYSPAAKPAPGTLADAHGAVAKRILVADDQHLNRMVLKTILAKIGNFETVLAVDGKDALDKLRQSANAGKKFDLVLTDMWMPNMDGETLNNEIKADKILKDTPVYAVTADVEVHKHSSSAAFTGIILKPVTIAKLKDVLEV